MAQIFCFGDSITYGSWDETQSGWVQRLRLRLDERMRLEDAYTLLYNLGIPGETTDSLVKRFELETEIRLDNKKEEALFIFAFGANDAAFIPSQQQFRVTEERYVQNFNYVLNKAKMWSNKILILTTTPVVEAFAVNPLGKDKSRKNEWVERYNNQIKGLANNHGVPIVDIYSAFMEEGYEDLFVGDGLHPNAQGHELILNRLLPVLTEILERVL